MLHFYEMQVKMSPEGQSLWSQKQKNVARGTVPVGSSLKLSQFDIFGALLVMHSLKLSQKCHQRDSPRGPKNKNVTRGTVPLVTTTKIAGDFSPAIVTLT